jgi:hypothetical protein
VYELIANNVRYKVLTAVNMAMFLFWVLAPSGLVGR